MDDQKQPQLPVSPSTFEKLKAMFGGDMRQIRRHALRRSFTRFVASRPIGDEAAGRLGAKWRAGMKSWQDGWATARSDSSTVRLGRRAEKADRLRLWRRKRMVLISAKRAARAQKNIALLAAAVNRAFGG